MTVPSRKRTADGVWYLVQAIDLCRPEAYLLLLLLITFMK